MLNWIRIIFLLSIPVLFQTCAGQEEFKNKKYSFVVRSTDEKSYIWQTNNLDSGVVNPIEKGVWLDGPSRIWYYLIVKNGFYYYVDSKSEFFVKAEVQDARFVHLDSIPLTDFGYPDNSLFIDEDTVFLISHSLGLRPKKFAKVNVKMMTATVGTLPIPGPVKPFDNMSVGFEMWRNNYLWIGYTYHYSNRDMGYGSSDTVYVARMTYPGMKLEHIDKDARSTYPGNVNTAQQNTFKDEKGDFYFLSCPGIVRGANPDQPTAIYRIKANTTRVDSSYFFNISASKIQNHAYGLWYLGNNKALLRSERKDLFKNYKDHYLVPHIEYFEVDLLNMQVQKLNLPLDRGSSRTCVLVENEKAYITINDGKGNNDVWIYQTKNQSLKKGLHFEGNIDYIFRLERLNE
ncbi:DUF4374 domain-containing protein [Dyadobacter psychrotolerans]|uniref:DUF4374 domain-containing protein n=1 Tax=Dyadobacter psychrotolerans TaxID=2541721 RepID=A0A4R5D8K9_9BACT|nr:DUF4374 domain-containing protein [Dyadobacter psychrotolerans]TDE08071.1 DUF4374 domain-containing protein [Dyadobacter psychrotolerans]